MIKRKDKLQGDVGAFLKQYQRKAYPTHDPNDRHYSRDVERKVKSMNPRELCELMSGEGEDILAEEEAAWFAGENPKGVLFSLNQPVETQLGVTGYVVSLLQVRPVPKYWVKLSDGEDVEIYQNSLSESPSL